MFGWLALRSARAKLASSIARDPLRTGDPAAWLAGASTVLELRTRCPHPGWLVHCAYWAGIKTNDIGAAAIALADHAQRQVGFGVGLHDLSALSMPELADRIVAVETQFPAIRAIDSAMPLTSTRWIHHLHPARLAADPGPAAPIELDRLSREERVAGGVVLALVGEFHRQGFAKEALVLTAAGAGTMFALGLPAETGALLALQRTRYGWPTSMTSTTFTR